MKNQKIEEVVELAQIAFFQEVAKNFPEIKSGDFPPEAQVNFERACSDAIKIWVQSNS